MSPDTTTTPAFPDPASPEGQRWAAAGFPVENGQPAIPAAPVVTAAPAATAAELGAGSVALYAVHDPYHPAGARDRDQVILITGHDTAADGSTVIRGIALGFADQAASFQPGQLRPAG